MRFARECERERGERGEGKMTPTSGAPLLLPSATEGNLELSKLDTDFQVSRVSRVSPLLHCTITQHDQPAIKRGNKRVCFCWWSSKTPACLAAKMKKEKKVKDEGEFWLAVVFLLCPFRRTLHLDPLFCLASWPAEIQPKYSSQALVAGSCRRLSRFTPCRSVELLEPVEPHQETSLAGERRGIAIIESPTLLLPLPRICLSDGSGTNLFDLFLFS
jgi:hypothetical protein